MEYICKHCGDKQNDLSFFLILSCSKSPTGKHQPFEGGVQSEYICKHCGDKQNNLSFFLTLSCSKSPTGKHQPL